MSSSMPENIAGEIPYIVSLVSLIILTIENMS
jgi:hypothetical protein